MPYLTSLDKRDVDKDGPDSAGGLNYAFTKLIIEYMRLGESYQRYNDCIGALENCKLELYRRRVAPYEDIKIQTNGDVY